MKNISFFKKSAFVLFQVILDKCIEYSGREIDKDYKVILLVPQFSIIKQDGGILFLPWSFASSRRRMFKNTQKKTDIIGHWKFPRSNRLLSIKTYVDKSNVL